LADELDASPGTDLSTFAARYADGAAGLTLRAAIASIPIVGSSVSVIVEAKLSKRQSDRVETLFLRIAALEASAVSSAAHRPSDALVEAAVMASAGTADQERPAAFANILYLNGAGHDGEEVLRRFLLEVLATLSRYEIALLLRHAPDDGDARKSDFAERMLNVHSRNPEVDEVRQFALGRLETFRLIRIEKGVVDVTKVGRHLLSAV
jgi:hypothetical protein